MSEKDTQSIHAAIKKTADILARRDHSEQELREKLLKFFDPHLVEQAIAEAWEKKWLMPPLELAKKATESWSLAGKSEAYITEQLLRRGLPTLEPDGETEIEKMKFLLKKKFKDWVDSDSELRSDLNYEERIKAYRYLSSRGFADELIRKVIHEEP